MTGSSASWSIARRGCAPGRLVDDDAPGRRLALEPGRRVDDVPRDEPLAELGPGLDGDDRHAGGHRGADGEVEAGVFRVQLVDGIGDAERGAHGSLGIVLVRDRGAEDRHDGVADELLDRSPEAFDLALQEGVVRPERWPGPLRGRPRRTAR